MHPVAEPAPKKGVPLDLSRKLTGVLVPVFALRSENDLGIGDVECVRQMVDWCARHSISVLQVLPVNETGDDNSPYNAISSMALDPTTIAVFPDSIPGLTRAAFERHATPSLLTELRRGPVQYRKVKALKSTLLLEAYAHFKKSASRKKSSDFRRYEEFLETEAHWLDAYSHFRALMKHHGNRPVWEDWPAEHASPIETRKWLGSCDASTRSSIEANMGFFCYIQWIAREQWRALKTHATAKGVQLMGDIPFGIGRCSADVWANRDLFDLYWSCGAPPETFFKPDLFTERWGQNWGIPLYRWNLMRDRNFDWWKARIRGTSEIFHLFRIDHVLGFYRIYAFPWKPEDNHLYTNLSYDEARAKSGDLPRFWQGHDDDPKYRPLNHQQGEELLRMVLDAAGNTGVIAEDLGMVPTYVRPSLTQMGIPGFKIPLFERNQDGSYKNSDEYQPLSIATLATHDHEPIASLWHQWQTAPHGPSEKSHLLRWIDWDPANPPQKFTKELHTAIALKLLACPSWLALFMITDLFARTQRFNVPGPSSDSNWTERLEETVAAFDRIEACKSILTMLPRK